MTRYIIKECAVCGQRFEPDIEITGFECLNCHTVYDLVNRKVDHSRTMVSPSECRHHRRIFVSSMRGGGDDYHITVCSDCGEFAVAGRANGQPYRVTFALVNDEAVEAAGKWAMLIKAEEAKP